MKTPLQQRLALVAPSIDIKTSWIHDEDEEWGDPLNRDWTKGEEPDDWQAWRTEVTATVIVAGTIRTGIAHLGGTWERADDKPWESNPDISGYEPQKIDEALGELEEEADDFPESLLGEISRARCYLRLVRKERYERQRKSLSNKA